MAVIFFGWFAGAAKELWIQVCGWCWLLRLLLGMLLGMLLRMLLRMLLGVLLRILLGMLWMLLLVLLMLLLLLKRRLFIWPTALSIQYRSTLVVVLRVVIVVRRIDIRAVSSALGNPILRERWYWWWQRAPTWRCGRHTSAHLR